MGKKRQPATNDLGIPLKAPKSTIPLPPLKEPPKPAEPLVTGFPKERLSQLTIEDLLTFTGALVVFDPGCLYRADGTPVSLDELPEIARLAIQGLEVLEEYEGTGQARINVGVLKKIRPADRLKAIEMYAELKGWKAGKGDTTNRPNLLGEYFAAVREGIDKEKK